MTKIIQIDREKQEFSINYRVSVAELNAIINDYGLSNQTLIPHAETVTKVVETIQPFNPYTKPWDGTISPVWYTNQQSNTEYDK